MELMDVLSINIAKNIGVVGFVITDFNIVVIPSVSLICLQSWKELALGNIEENCGENASSNQIDSIVMRKVKLRVKDVSWNPRR